MRSVDGEEMWCRRLSRTTIGDIEVGRRQVTANHLPLFCRALDVPLSVLVAGADAADLDALGAGNLRSR